MEDKQRRLPVPVRAARASPAFRPAPRGGAKRTKGAKRGEQTEARQEAYSQTRQ